MRNNRAIVAGASALSGFIGEVFLTQGKYALWEKESGNVLVHSLVVVYVERQLRSRAQLFIKSTSRSNCNDAWQIRLFRSTTARHARKGSHVEQFSVHTVRGLHTDDGVGVRQETTSPRQAERIHDPLEMDRAFGRGVGCVADASPVDDFAADLTEAFARCSEGAVSRQEGFGVAQLSLEIVLVSVRLHPLDPVSEAGDPFESLLVAIFTAYILGVRAEVHL